MAVVPDTQGANAPTLSVHGSDAPSPPISSAETVEQPVVRRPRRRWWIPAVAVAAVLAVVSAVAITVTTAYSADITRGVHVAGVDIGGMSRAQAARKLRAKLAGRIAAPVPVRVGRVTAEFSPADAGLTLDVDATVAAAARARPGPLSVLFGEHPVAPAVSVDLARLYPVLQPHVGDQGAAPTQPAVRYEGLTPKPVYPQPGTGLDRHRAAALIRAGWLRKSRIDVPISPLQPQTTRADVDRLLADLATPAVAAPVTLSTPKGDVEVPPAAIAASLILESDDDGRITPRIDEAKLRQALGDRLKPVETPGKNAVITIKDGKPAVTPHVDGQTVDLAALAPGLVAVLGQPAPRRVTAALTAFAPQLTADQFAQLGIVEKVSTFTTRFVAGQSRVTNIKKVADLARGKLLKPGETFSLNGLTGERTLAKGYVAAPAIVAGGKLKNVPGGGVSQFATTTFNAMYHAGLEDVEHKPHSYYFDRYPAVIEATTNWPELDLKFRNDSPHGILIDTSYTATSLTVSLWGTKRYDIETVYGPRTNVTSPQTVHLQEADCTATSGLPGFAQEAWRVFKQGGKEVKRQRFYWRYTAEPKFICGPPPAATPPTTAAAR